MFNTLKLKVIPAELDDSWSGVLQHAGHVHGALKRAAPHAVWSGAKQKAPPMFRRRLDHS
ncbi:MAG TPA: hypothetical protein VM166_02650 [Gemmatimonadaceae bacterium]|nr:hypothetical protein [Gemmatimonadaceae bacterium]